MKHLSLISRTFLLSLVSVAVFAQERVASASDWLKAQPIPDRTVAFCLSDTGVAKPITWGLDLAWLSEQNIKRGMVYMGAEKVDIIRSSFTPTSPLVNGELAASELGTVKERLRIIGLFRRSMNLALNSDHPSVDASFAGHPTEWAKLIDVTTRLHEEAGHKVVTVSPFNEPDYVYTGQGTVDDFYAIAGELRKNPRFDSIRISGGNTLNTDAALEWYSTLKDRLDEGNTHQLAGSFDHYASFFQTVRANGHHATNDELHNVMEAMVGVEYGLQTGIWWGTTEYARSEFVKASDGRRLGYAEHRPNWTAASVYRNPDGQVEAFVGASERQALTTSYRFFSPEKEVFFDGEGPQHEFTVEIPGGTGYETNQPNAERVVAITWGEDIQPVIEGTYLLMNRNSGKVMEVENGSRTAGANIRQGTSTSAAYQQWKVAPLEARSGGDFSYYSLKVAHTGMSPDVYNWSLNNGGNVVAWDTNGNSNQQWFLEYAGEGWFYIRNRFSAKCLEVAGSSKVAGANIQQNTLTGAANQQWRFLPVGTKVEFTPPAAPTGLRATAQPASVRLDWKACTETDLAGYTVFRADSLHGPYETLARNLTDTAFVDHKAVVGRTYWYKLKAVDKALNTSDYSEEVAASVTAAPALVAHLTLNESLKDVTVQQQDAVSSVEPTFVEGYRGQQAFSFNGSSAFLQLPSRIAHQRQLTLAFWMYWKGGASLQPVFDFGNCTDGRMYFTPRSANWKVCFGIEKGAEKQLLEVTRSVSLRWTHVAITLDSTCVTMYVNGEQVARSDSAFLSPMDLQPVLNYLGRGQEANTPLFKGSLQDFRVYNYALPAEAIARLVEETNSGVELMDTPEEELLVAPLPAREVLYVECPAQTEESLQLQLYTLSGTSVRSGTLEKGGIAKIEVGSLPSNVYVLRALGTYRCYQKKFVVVH